jgi:LemA protein
MLKKAGVMFKQLIKEENDLIGNLVKTVQGAAEYEKGTLAVIEVKATQVTVDCNITPEQLTQFNQAQSD